MTTSTRQDNDFLDAVISKCLLEEAIDWIKSNLDPDEVFDDDSLHDWANENGYMMEN